jgi:protoheme IX farnesyltransferase
MGWTAARGEISAGGWSLFLILFFWQLPHFLAIAWMYREDYARGGFVMLPVVDPDGTRTGMQAVGHTLGLMSISLFPVILGLTGVLYGLGAVLFFFSILYLPLLLGLMVFDKIKH